MNEQISELGVERKIEENFIFQLESSHLVVSVIRWEIQLDVPWKYCY